MTDDNIWMVNLNSPIHFVTKQVSHLDGCFCAFEILVALATKHDLVAVVYMGSLALGLGLGLQGWYSVTNYADNIPGRFTIIPQIKLQE